jgi:hypothetical protein
MSLQKEALAQGIIALQKDMMKKTDPAIEEYANRLADLIDTFVKTGTVTVATGILVSTTGSATAQTGSTTATGIGTIN